MEEVGRGSDAEIDLQEELGGGTSRCESGPMLVDHEACLLVRRPGETECAGIPTDAAMDLGGGTGAARESAGEPLQASIDPWAARDHRRQRARPSVTRVTRRSARTVPRLQQTVASAVGAAHRAADVDVDAAADGT
jgi:hypothetical protein